MRTNLIIFKKILPVSGSTAGFNPWLLTKRMSGIRGM